MLTHLRAGADALRRRNFHKWLDRYLLQLAGRALRPGRRGQRHLLFALCDHFEPLWGDADDARGAARVRRWVTDYPRLAAAFRDADGRRPQHTFFYPGEQYRPALLDGLAQIARSGLGEVELHLHHDGDTEETLRRAIRGHVRRLADHGHLSRDAAGQPRYAFIHGNWCLANARDDRRWCGVDGELPLLHETGCYADFTFPAAPDESQPRRINAVYWPSGDLRRRRAYDGGGLVARVGEHFDDRVLLVQGPLALTPRVHRRPLRIENGHIAAGDPPSPARLRSWVAQGIHVRGRPEWVFVKTCIHGAPEPTAASYLGGEGRRLHRTLARRYNDGRRWVLHYVTARELYNIALAAMCGASGDPGRFRDFRLAPPPVAGS